MATLFTFNNVPTVYPKINKVLGSDWFELVVPDNTPGEFVRDLAVLVPRPMRQQIDGQQIDGWHIRIASHFRGSVERLLIAHFGDFEAEVTLEECPNCAGLGEVYRYTRTTTSRSECFLCKGTGKRRVNEKQDGPQVILVEYIGACRERKGARRRPQSTTCPSCGGLGVTNRVRFNGPTQSCNACSGRGSINLGFQPEESFASAWINGGWNAVFPEDVLRAYFPPPPEKFDGDFFKGLLGPCLKCRGTRVVGEETCNSCSGVGTSIKGNYRLFARQFHPDLNKGKQASNGFRKLKDAFDVLSDPKRRKRYEAGLKFQKLTDTQKQEVVFRIPKSCGRVSVEGSWSIRANAASVSKT